MPVRERHGQEIAGQCERQHLSPSVRQQFVTTYNTLREAKNAFCTLTFREYRLSWTKIDLGSEPLKLPKLKRIGDFSAEQSREERARHSPPSKYRLPGFTPEGSIGITPGSVTLRGAEQI